MNTKHRWLISVLGLLVALVCMAGFAACDNNDTCEHQWGDWTVTTKATCTEAGISERKCTACGQTETSTLEALGHDWTQATCSTPKTCKACAATDGEAAPHTYTLETVKDEALKSAASCTGAAVYYKSCTCGAISSQDADTFSSGDALAHHDSEGDNDHACDTCGAADITSHTFGEDACDTPAICSECGAAADQVPEHTDANLDHICDHNCGKNDMGACTDSATDADHVCDYGCGKALEGCSDADTDADHACDVCGKAEITEHTYANDTVTKAPTCAQAGESTAYCACGKTQVTPIPATNAHTFANGACTTCGKVDDSCDHTTLHIETLDLSALGACNGTLYYKTCDCGQAKELYEMDINCDLEETGDEYVDPNGNAVMSMYGVCSCGLEVTASAIMQQDGCAIIYDFHYIFSFSGEPILDTAWTQTSIYHQNREYVTVDLTEYGACGGTLEKMVCADCGDLISISDIAPDCNIDFDAEPEGEEMVDENGVVHVIQTVECPDCGLKVTTDTVIEQLSPCEWLEHVTATLSCGETVIFTNSYAYSESDHTYEYIYDLHGVTCEDGVTVTEQCTACDYRYSYEQSWHDEIEHDVVIDLSEYGICEGFVNVDLCTACGFATEINDSENTCDMEIEAEEEILNENGKVIGYITRYTCSKCGVEYQEREWTKYVSPCESAELYGEYIFVGETCILALIDTWYQTHHTYEYTYELYGSTCEDGYKVIEYCTTCGDSNSWNSYYHRSEEFELNLADHGGCGGRIYGDRCAACGEITYVYNVNTNCEVNMDWVTPEEHVDNQGNLHSVYTIPCPDCAFIYVIDTWQIQQSACVTVEYETLTIYLGEECIFANTSQYSESTHDYTYTYEMEGETCEDGYYVYYYCTKCGESGQDHYYGHTSQWSDISLDQYLPCGGWIEEEYCVICQSTLYSNVNEYCRWDYVGSTNEYELYECSDCGAIKRVDYHRSEKDENCRYVYTEAYSYFVNDELVFQYEWSYTDEEHDYTYEFEMLGASCTDGYTYTATCVDCGYRWTSVSYQHQDYLLFTLSDEPGCCPDHDVEAYGCICGYYLNFGFDESSFTCVDEYTLYVCESCNLVIDLDMSQVDNGCSVTEINTVTVLLSDEVIYSNTKEYVIPSHHYSNLETSVADGITYITVTCEQCGLTGTTLLNRVEMESQPDGCYYDYVVTPDQTSKYTIMGLAENDTYVELYKLENGKLIKIAYNDDGGDGLQFSMECTLEAGTTYVFQISFYGQSEEGVIDFAFSQNSTDFDFCLTNTGIEFSVPLTPTEYGETRVLYGEICQGCGNLEYYYIEYES